MKTVEERLAMVEVQVEALKIHSDKIYGLIGDLCDNQKKLVEMIESLNNGDKELWETFEKMAKLNQEGFELLSQVPNLIESAVAPDFGFVRKLLDTKHK